MGFTTRRRARGVFRVETKCPYCGARLREVEGERGNFLACPRFPACRYTEQIQKPDEVKYHKEPSPYCEKCDHTGRLPFFKDGKVVPDVKVYCDCYHDVEEEGYQTILPEDFDFPMSYDWYRGLCQEYGWPDPGNDDPPLREPTESIVVHRHSDMSKQEHDMLEQMTRRVQWLEQKMAEKSLGKPGQSNSYKGIK